MSMSSKHLEAWPWSWMSSPWPWPWPQAMCPWLQYCNKLVLSALLRLLSSVRHSLSNSTANNELDKLGLQGCVFIKFQIFKNLITLRVHHNKYSYQVTSYNQFFISSSWVFTKHAHGQTTIQYLFLSTSCYQWVPITNKETVVGAYPASSACSSCGTHNTMLMPKLR